MGAIRPLFFCACFKTSSNFHKKVLDKLKNLCYNQNIKH
nr:MAG TPA: hypothetical protein [Caudoviricetes sp.]